MGNGTDGKEAENPLYSQSAVVLRYEEPPP